jgi:folate-binding Fe-S cluster repair protein YgfZ
VNNFSAIEISGADAAAFLQGQLTCDVLILQPDSASLMASCDRKGRMVANGIIYFTPPLYYLILPASMVTILLTHLKKYATFSKVALEPKSDSQIIEHARNFISDNKNLVFIEPKTSGLFTPQMIDWQKQGGVSFT